MQCMYVGTYYDVCIYVQYVCVYLHTLWCGKICIYLIIISMDSMLYVYVCMYVCMHVCMYACMHVCMWSEHVFEDTAGFYELIHVIATLLDAFEVQILLLLAIEGDRSSSSRQFLFFLRDTASERIRIYRHMQWDWISTKQNCLMHTYTYSTYKQYFGTQEFFQLPIL